MKSRLLIYGLGIFGLILFGGFFLPRLANGKQPKIPLAQMEIRNLDAALFQYHMEMGEHPLGTKANILKKLRGENSKKISFFNANPKSVNSAGEFMDPWKTPYEISIVGQTNYTIRSAGPNRIFGDKDDLVFDSSRDKR